jgi:hypothetical protein
MRARNGLLASALAIALASTALDAPAATPPAGEADVSDWVGRFCTPLGCSGASRSTLGNTLGFGVAAVSVAFLARRRRA